MLKRADVREDKAIHRVARKKDALAIPPVVSKGHRSEDRMKCPNCKGNATMKKSCEVCEAEGSIQSKAMIRKKIITTEHKPIVNKLAIAMVRFQNQPTDGNEKAFITLLMDKLSK